MKKRLELPPLESMRMGDVAEVVNLSNETQIVEPAKTGTIFSPLAVWLKRILR